MQQDITVLLQLGSFSVSSYSLVLMGGALLSILLTLILHRKDILTALSVSIAATLGAILGGHLFWCLINLGKLPDYATGTGLLWQFQMGGYSLAGAVIGGLIGISLLGLVTRKPVPALFDMATPGSLLAIAAGRAAEVFTSQGLGEYIENETLQRFPCGICVLIEDGEWRIPVFLFEACVALILCVTAILLIQRAMKPGRLTGNMLALLCASQILLEQLRRDDYLRFGFVRVTQVAAILAMLFILIPRIRTQVTMHGWKTCSILRIVLLPLCALVVIFIEFAFEKGWVIPYLCISMLVTAALGACALVDRGCILKRKASSRFRASCCFISAVLAIGFTIWAVWAINQHFEWENIMLHGVMAVTLVGASAVVLCGDGTVA